MAQSITSAPTSVNNANGTKSITPAGVYAPGAGNGALYIDLELGYKNALGVFTSFNPKVTQRITQLNPNLTYTGSTWVINPVAGTTYVVRADLWGFTPPNPTPIKLATKDGNVP